MGFEATNRHDGIAPDIEMCSIPDFLQELPVLVKEATPTLSMMFGEDIERKLSVREIQTAFVHILVLGKKARVRLISTPCRPTRHR